MSDQELLEQEENATDQSVDDSSEYNDVEAGELQQLEENSPTDTSAEGGLYKSDKKQKKLTTQNPKRRRRRWAIAGAIGGILLILITLLVFFLASLKAVHFATILRSTGFATSQVILREAFSETAYSDWATQNDTAELPKSKLLDRLRSQDMRKIQQDLTNKGEFKYTIDADGKVTGFDIRGENVNFDDLAKKLGKESFNDLSFREKMSVRKYLTDKVRTNIGNSYDIEVRSYRNGFWKGFREVTDIKLTAFRDVVRDKFGNRQVNEKLNNDETRLSDEVDTTSGRNTPIEDVAEEIKEPAEAIDQDIQDSARKGIRKTAKEALNSYLESKGSSISQFEEGMSKVSTAVLVSTLYCIGHDLSHTSDRLNAQMEQSMARYGAMQQTRMDQIKNGDVTAGDVAFAGKEYNGSDSIPDGAASPLYQQALGRSNTPGDLSDAPRANMSLPLLDWLKPVDDLIRTAASAGLNKLDPTGTIDSAIDKAITSGCDVVLNPYTQGGILILDLGVSVVTLGTKDLITKGLLSVAIFAGFAGVGQLIENYISQFSGNGITGTETGAPKVTASFIATDYLNSQTSRGVTFGRPENNDESSSTKQFATQQIRNRYNQGSFSERYFAVDNPNSLLGTASAYAPTSLSQFAILIQSSLSHLSSLLASAFHIFGSIGSARVNAATNKDVSKSNDYFGVNQWGWTTQELATLQSENIFDNAAVVEADMQRDPNYYAKLAECYDSSKLLYQVAENSNCSADALKADRALQWRIYKLHEFAINQMSSEGINETL